MLGSALFAIAFSGPAVQIGGGVRRLSLLDISWLAAGEPSFTAAFNKIANLANFGIWIPITEWIALTILMLIITVMWNAWLKYLAESDDRLPGTMMHKEEEQIIYKMSTETKVLLLVLGAAICGHVYGLKTGFDYSELHEKASLRQPLQLEERFQIWPPRLGEKPGI
ncbi:hypothetical protein [Bosea sp. AAP35]|uniref:hypothetical protein n=1 Tax=Bosea sp. AAP35 TaxID=1523417 RepID=UPI0012E3002C|nr:hypothetical protein [Bosea sp. AAP35]